MSSDVPRGACLQCEQTREEVRINQTICGIEEGYEYRELVAEWPRHHWRDWSDAELKSAGIKPEFFDEYRRWSISALPYAACEHCESGHSFPNEDIYFGEYLMNPKGVCVTCGAKQSKNMEGAGNE